MTVVSLLIVTVGESAVFPTESLMVAVILTIPSLSAVMLTVVLHVPLAPITTEEETTLGVELSQSSKVTNTLPPTSPVPATTTLLATAELTMEEEAGTLTNTNVVVSFVKLTVADATF